MSPEMIRAHLSDILASPVFSKAARISRFLQFVVEASLEGRPERINEFAIGVEVYGRPETFDPRLDAIVRVEAGRLRSKLREYYEGAGKNAPLRITFPKGSYIPLFTEIAGTLSHAAARGGVSPRRPRTLAVLPFADLSPQRDQEYLGDGIAEELMFAISGLREIRVVSQTSVLALKGSRRDIREIGHMLGVDALVEGSVRKSDLRLRISAQVIDVSTGFRVWSNVYDRELHDVFAIQQDIARSVVAALTEALLESPGEAIAHPSTSSVAAHTAYLKGRFFWNRQTADSLERAIGEFEQAIREDPGFARAHIGISDCYRLLEFWGVLAPELAIPKAKQAVANALVLDSSLAEAHAADAVLEAVYKWNWASAEQRFRRVFHQLPNYPGAHQAYGAMCLVPQGRFNEAIDELKVAQQLDPLALWVNAQLGFVYFLNRQYEQAVKQLLKTLELDDCFYLAHMFLAAVYAEQGKLKDALAALQEAREQGGDSSRVMGWLALVNARMGRKKKVLEIAEELDKRSQSGYVCPLDLAKVQAAVGSKEQTLKYLEQSVERRCGRLVSAIVDPTYDIVRSEPRFTAVRARMNLQ
jgi:TolB-like protein/tetratricopeptide (TPR) repeat protein